MENKEINTRIKLESKIWQACDEDQVCKPFIEEGFDDTQEILDLRVYDMMNVLEGDRVMAEDLLFTLYFYFNVNEEADDAMSGGSIDLFFDPMGWACEHPDPAGVLVKDIVMADGMHAAALYELFDHIIREYWRSPEYDPELFWNREFMRMMRSSGMTGFEM